MRNKVKTILFMVSLIIGFSVKMNYLLIDQGNSVKEKEIQYESLISYPKRSGYFELPFIHIDGNWSDTAGNYTWCSGDGSWSNPYSIENVVINASNSPTGSGILINNSKNKYFIIRNCTVVNAPDGIENAGIKLENTNNGTLTNNNCYYCYGRFGIFLLRCNNNTISENFANSNGMGIGLAYCDDNTISGNTANNNVRGIQLSSCADSTISGNTANDNNVRGISLSGCGDSTISGNNASNIMTSEQDIGIYLSGCGDNNISGNTANDNNDYGIYLAGGSSANTISGNTVNSNGEYGIHLWNRCDDNIISGNTIYYNGIYGIFIEYLCEFNIILGNTLIGNDIEGIEDMNYETMNRINDVYTPIIIDNNGSLITWEMAIKHIPWFKGSGSWNDPYLIKDLTIEAYGSMFGIFIKNSIAYFIINNCTVYNAYEAAIWLENTSNGTLINNICSNNGKYGIFLNNNCNNNTIKENYLYFNTDKAINIYSADCYDTIILRNLLVSNDGKFINDDGSNTILLSNYFGNSPPSFIVEVLYQSFSTTDFVVTLKILNEINFEVYDLSIQIWWEGTTISLNNIDDLGNGLYNITLTPIFVSSGEDPILLNMTISATHHTDKYFELYIAVEPPEIPVKWLKVEITDHFYSLEHFNLSLFVGDEFDLGIDVAIIQMWWNGTDVSTSVQNLGDGTYFISLNPITVAPGEDPILLNMTVSASGYAEKYFETYIAVDPETLTKGEDTTPDELPPIVITIAIGSTIGALAVVGVLIMLLRRRK